VDTLIYTLLKVSKLMI